MKNTLKQFVWLLTLMLGWSLPLTAQTPAFIGVSLGVESMTRVTNIYDYSFEPQTDHLVPRVGGRLQLHAGTQLVRGWRWSVGLDMGYVRSRSVGKFAGELPYLEREDWQSGQVAVHIGITTASDWRPVHPTFSVALLQGLSVDMRNTRHKLVQQTPTPRYEDDVYFRPMAILLGAEVAGGVGIRRGVNLLRWELYYQVVPDWYTRGYQSLGLRMVADLYVEPARRKASETALAGRE